jgi:predicted esterase
MHHLKVERSARYATLGGEAGAVREIWFALHGYGQLAAQFICAFAPLDDGTRLIVAPEALNRFYVGGVETAPVADRSVGATWMTKEDRVNEIHDYVAYLDAVAAHVLGPLGTRASAPRVIVLGFSQGAATAARWVASGSIRPAQLILWGGFPPPDLDWSAQRFRSTPLRIILGSKDPFVSTDRLAEEEQRLGGLDAPYHLVRYEGGHGIGAATLRELAQSLGALA